MTDGLTAFEHGSRSTDSVILFVGGLNDGLHTVRLLLLLHQ